MPESNAPAAGPIDPDGIARHVATDPALVGRQLILAEETARAVDDAFEAMSDTRVDLLIGKLFASIMNQVGRLAQRSEGAMARDIARHLELQQARHTSA